MTLNANVSLSPEQNYIYLRDRRKWTIQWILFFENFSWYDTDLKVGCRRFEFFLCLKETAFCFLFPILVRFLPFPFVTHKCYTTTTTTTSTTLLPFHSMGCWCWYWVCDVLRPMTSTSDVFHVFKLCHTNYNNNNNNTNI